MSKIRPTLSYYLLLLIVVMLSFQASAWGVEKQVYGVMRIAIIFVVALLFVVSFEKRFLVFLRVKIVRMHFIMLLLFLFYGVVFSVLGFNFNYSPLRDLLLALFVVFIGYNLNLSDKDLFVILVLFTLGFLISALSVIYAFSDGFVIQERYLPVPKNQYAPMYGMASIFAIVCGFKSVGWKRYALFLVSAVLFGALLTLRGRAAIIATSFLFLVIFFWYFEGVRYKLYFLLAAFLAFPFLASMLYDSLFLNYDVSSIDSVSTGRFSVYMQGLDFLFDNPAGGMMEASISSESAIHNYALYNLANYGVVVSFPVIFLYLCYFCFLLRLVLVREFSIHTCGHLAMLMIFFVSLFEYTLPYAPGTTVFFPFLLLGLYFSRSPLRG